METSEAFLSDAKWAAIARELGLSAREAQIARLLLNDDSEGSIAWHLNISSHTVHSHLERMYRKLDVTSRTQLVTRVFKEYIALQVGR